MFSRVLERMEIKRIWTHLDATRGTNGTNRQIFEEMWKLCV
jgi:hypothetical protein